MNKHIITQLIEQKNGRLTPLRETLIDLFITTKKPLSVPEIIEMLGTLGKDVNKTSVYRQIQFLQEMQIILELQLDKARVHYELSNLDHHHHLVCNNCQKVEHVDVPNIEKHISHLQNETLEEKGFSIVSHNLEFYGLCRKCSPQRS